MRSDRCLLARASQLAVLSILLVFAPAVWAGSTYKAVYSFKGGNDGIAPQGNLVVDASGNLYGTTIGGGSSNSCNSTYKGCGIVFQLLREPTGPWKENVLYRFKNGENTGIGLHGDLAFDTAGNLYGTTFYQAYVGTVFQLSPGAAGWTEKTIYTFCQAGCGDGETPGAGVVLDKTGNLYGTTTQGGADGGGVIFKLAPDGSGWTESVVYSFCPYESCASGWLPWALLEDASGNLYGTTTYGGNYFWPCTPGDGCGAVFELSPTAGGWSYTVLHRFAGRDGAFPNSGVIRDKQGNVYGTTTNDGAFGCGTVFQLSPKAKGSWRYSVLYNLRGGVSAGSLAVDSAGNLYGANSGTTFGSCQGPSNGEIFKLSPRAHSHWKHSSVHKFNSASSGLIFDEMGHLYGTASSGGTYGYGVVFELTP